MGGNCHKTVTFYCILAVYNTRVKEYVDITKYSELDNETLLQEARDLREFIDRPRLSKRHYLSATLLSVVGPGSTLAAIVGYTDYLFHMHDTPGSKSTEPLKARKDYTEKLRGLLVNWKNRGEYLNDPNNRGFRNNLVWTLTTFVVATIATFPLFLKWQRRSRAHESAVKLGQVERVLEERGFERSVTNYSHYTHSWATEREKQARKEGTFAPVEDQKKQMAKQETTDKASNHFREKALEEAQKREVPAILGA